MRDAAARLGCVTNSRRSAAAAIDTWRALALYLPAYAGSARMAPKGGTHLARLVDLAYRDGRVEGEIGNDPGIVTNVKFANP
jgi:hypothetical protein